MPDQHAKLSPSGSKRWFACPGSVVLEAAFPDKVNDYSDSGTAMHTIAGFILTPGGTGFSQPAVGWVGGTVPVNSPGEPFRKVDFTDDMAELVQGYVDFVRQLAAGHQTWIEERVDFSVFIDVPDQFGTADAIVIDADQGELVVIDLKTGHTPVFVEDNSQLMLYALGALQRITQTAGVVPPVEENEDVLW